MVNVNGLDSKAIADYQMLLIRANKEQLPALMVLLEAEIAKRDLIKNSQLRELDVSYNINKVLFPNGEDW